MIVWPKLDEMGYDSNGFKQRLSEVLVNYYSQDPQQINAKFQKWRKLIIEIPALKYTNPQLIKKKLRKGVPDNLRIKIWPLIIQNNTEFPDYKKVLQQKKFLFEKAIDLDLTRTFPQNIYFQQSTECYRSLRNLLNIISAIFPKMGYCQGLNFIAATIILKTNDQQAYHIICHILQNLNHKYLLSDLNLVRRHLYVLQKIVELKYYDLWKKLKDNEIETIQYATSWFVTLFCHCLPFEYNLRILDCYLFEGEKIIYRVALQLLQYKRERIMKMDSFDQILLFLKNYIQFNSISVDDFFNNMFKIQLSRKQIQKYEQQYKKQSNVS